MECTGRYHEPMVKALSEAGLFVSIVNPHLIKNFGNNSLRKVKSDPADARKKLDGTAPIFRYGQYTYSVKNFKLSIQLLYEAKGCRKSKSDCTVG